jgi:hypothetical protein
VRAQSSPEGSDNPLEGSENAFVDANDATAAQAAAWHIDGILPFLCECDRRDCVRIVSMTLAEYRRSRAQPGVRVLAPGH